MLRAALTVLCLAAPAAAQDAALLERGRHLVEVTGACGNCHTPMGRQGPLASRHPAGGTVFDEPPFRAVAPNTTPDAETGIGRWTDAQRASAIREGKRPDGSLIDPPMPFAFYRGLADREPPRVCRRPHGLRGWGHDEEDLEPVFA
jgi:mono/diheme cytochrome c family protein